MLGESVRAWVLAVAAAVVLASYAAAPVFAQAEASKGAPATVAGRVTDGKRGLAGVAVTLMLNSAAPWSPASVSAKTDAEGRYRVSGLVPGRYQIVPVAPAHVAEGAEAERGRSLLLGAGETVENVDFRLTRGGVITGRVTGADGKPLVGEFVRVTVENSQRPAHGYARPDRTELLTDDRGVYRVYGLAAGRYQVSVGSDGPPRGGRNTSTGGTQTFYQRTYYDDTTDAAQAKLVEVTEGAETTDIDISVEKTTRQTYVAAGRIVFAENGQPAANVRVGYGPAGRGGRAAVMNFGGFGPSGSAVVADERGEFKLAGLASGRYVAFAVRDGSPDWYSEQVSFEIADADAEGIEVKLRRGSSVSGVVQFDGVSDRATVSGLFSRSRVFAINEPPGGGPPAPGASVNTVIAPDGSFSFKGLQPGKIRISISGNRDSGVSLLRVEHNGAQANNGIEVAEGAQVTGVRVVAAYGNAVIRGQVNVTGGTLARGSSLRVVAGRLGDEDGRRSARTVEADSRGAFIMEGMIAGEYEIYAAVYSMGGPGGPPPPPGGGAPRPSGRGPIGPRQRVTITQGGDHNITLVLPLSEGGNQ